MQRTISRGGAVHTGGGIDGRRRGRKRKKKKKKEGEEERRESTWRPVFWNVHRQPPSPSVFSSPLCARLPCALHFLFLLHPCRSLVFERKRETLEVARKNDESITIAPKLYDFSVESNYIILIKFIFSLPHPFLLQRLNIVIALPFMS